jgi:hypothetical protein
MFKYYLDQLSASECSAVCSVCYISAYLKVTQLGIPALYETNLIFSLLRTISYEFRKREHFFRILEKRENILKSTKKWVLLG